MRLWIYALCDNQLCDMILVLELKTLHNHPDGVEIVKPPTPGGLEWPSTFQLED